MNWLDFITEKDFKKNLPPIFEERTGCRFLKASVKKINDKKFGTCFLCNVLMEESDTKFTQTMKFGQYGLVDENTNEYEYNVDYKEFLKFMILNLQNNKFDSRKYEEAYISNHQSHLLKEMNTSIKELTESTQTEIQKRLLNLDKIFNPILIKASVLNQKQENVIDYTNKSWIDLIDIKTFDEKVLPKLLDKLIVKPNEVMEIEKENNKTLGPCLVVKTFKSRYRNIESKYVYSSYNDYEGEYGITLMDESYHYDYKFANFGIIDGTIKAKYNYDYRHLLTNEVFVNFMINETMGKTINHKTYADELNSFLEHQKQLIEQEELQHLQKTINEEKIYYANEIKRDSEEIARNIQGIKSLKSTSLEENELSI